MPESWAAGAGIALDHEGDVPLGIQLDWAFRAAIAAGRLRAGERLPGLRDVADALGVNHNTVRAAVAKLEAEGLLQTRHGAGTFVAAGAAMDGRRAALLDETADRARDAGVAPRDLAAALYVAETATPGPPDEAAAERRSLREELAVLDRVLVALAHVLREPEVVAGVGEPLVGQQDQQPPRTAAAHGCVDTRPAAAVGRRATRAA